MAERPESSLTGAEYLMGYCLLKLHGYTHEESEAIMQHAEKVLEDGFN